MNQLTIILTLKNRSNFTLRWMHYMNMNQCKYKIFIADGGDDKEIERILSNKNNYPNINYEYHRYPFDANLECYFRKLNSIINLVNTKYVLQADNDDFFILDEIPKFINFLEINEKHIGARGSLVDLYYSGKNDSPKNPTCSKYFLKQIFSESIELNEPLKRIEFLCDNISKFDYYANWYCVFRTENLRKTWNKLMPLNIPNMIVVEMCMHIYMLNYGKIKVFNEPFYIRQSGSSIHGDTLTEKNEFLESFFLQNFVKQLEIGLNAEETLDFEQNRTILLKSIASWFQIFNYNLYGSRVKVNNIKKKFVLLINYFKHQKTLKITSLDNYLLSKNVDYNLSKNALY